MGLLDYMQSHYNGDCQQCFPTLMLQQIDNLTGLRVETTIREVKKMVNSEMIKLEDHRILY